MSSPVRSVGGSFCSPRARAQTARHKLAMPRHRPPTSIAQSRTVRTNQRGSPAPSTRQRRAPPRAVPGAFAPSRPTHTAERISPACAQPRSLAPRPPGPGNEPGPHDEQQERPAGRAFDPTGPPRVACRPSVLNPRGLFDGTPVKRLGENPSSRVPQICGNRGVRIERQGFRRHLLALTDGDRPNTPLQRGYRRSRDRQCT